MNVKLLLCILFLIPLAASSAVPVVVVKRNPKGGEVSSELGVLFYAQHRGTDGMIFEFIADGIFKDGFDGKCLPPGA